ncbi:PapD-like protein [Phycomyces nitens]|nr:PapD-like protein [Phycomyces nitens]
MSVQLSPSNALVFKRPLQVLSKEILVLKNPGAESIIFKVKTTAPKQYCVRPNSGLIEPYSELQVQVILQPLKEEPPLDFQCKDKFLVQTAVIDQTLHKSIPLAELWHTLENRDKGAIQQHKLRCMFLSPKEAEKYRLGDPAEESGSKPSGSPRSPRSEPEGPPPVYSQQDSIPDPAVLINLEEAKVKLEKELEDAQETIRSLISQIEKEKHSPVQPKTSKKLPSIVQPLDAVHRHLAQLEKSRTTEGYPPQVVLMLAMLVFLVTLIFF